MTRTSLLKVFFCDSLVAGSLFALRTEAIVVMTAFLENSGGPILMDMKEPIGLH